ncbi:ABC transporter substrate-binding protein [Vibrio sp. ZSDE26]|uniref:ABC transporter substrate-binding protein n=1 Tax=Vibrio amylolyticus TaxID=2847292 RepID=A0A9X2BLT1_9VIBR|nr:ABC transporter substrate-binding protein [Vibrio amylolyticus]MCK6264248.1 ABC transporter substrate-binding protein [Vibrio amylolyticus]
MSLLKLNSLPARLALSGIVTLGALYTPVTVASAPNSATYAMYADIKDWDPSIAFSMEVVMLSNVYEPLLWYNPPGSEEKFSPALATDWNVSQDGLTWTFNLRKNVTFHDGTPFNAEAAKLSLQRTIDMKKGAYYIWSSVDSIEASDDYTLTIKTKTPAAIDLIASSQYGAYIYSPTAADKGSEWFNQGNAAGTGPYKVSQWQKGQHVVLDKNDSFWGGWNDKQLDRVVLKLVSNPATQVQMIKAGDADFISLPSADLVQSLANDKNIVVQDTASWKNSQFLINTQKYPTDNVKFRQALSLAWDYESVVDYVYAGGATVAKGAIPSTMWGADDSIKAPEFNLAKARELLKESGVPKSDWNISLAYINSSESYKNASLLYQENLRQIGVSLELRPGPWGKIWNDAKNLRTAPNLQSMTWWPTYATPSDWLIGLFRTEESASFNLSHYSNTQYDALVDKGVQLEGSDRPQAIDLYQQAQRILVDDAVAIFYADLKGRNIYRKELAGVRANPAYTATFFYPLTKD